MSNNSIRGREITTVRGTTLRVLWSSRSPSIALVSHQRGASRMVNLTPGEALELAEHLRWAGEQRAVTSIILSGDAPLILSGDKK